MKLNKIALTIAVTMPWLNATAADGVAATPNTLPNNTIPNNATTPNMSGANTNIDTSTGAGTLRLAPAGINQNNTTNFAPRSNTNFPPSATNPTTVSPAPITNDPNIIRNGTITNSPTGIPADNSPRILDSSGRPINNAAPNGPGTTSNGTSVSPR